jgi:iron complex transport system ATP-binding protein
MRLVGPVLTCSNLSCGYLQKSILSGIDLCVEPGETIAILGPNGAGKSCLLKTLSGELKPISGRVEVRFDNTGEMRDVFALGSRQTAQAIASVPQEELIPFPFSVLEVVTMGRLSKGDGVFDSAEDLDAAKAAIDLADCTELIQRNVMELSGGEKQRVLIARAIAQDTPILLMDEPTSHLDPAHQQSIVKLVQKLAGRGIAVVSVVHDLNLACLLATRALLISNGTVVMDDRAEKVIESELLEHAYSSRFERLRTPQGRLIVVPSA